MFRSASTSPSVKRKIAALKGAGIAMFAASPPEFQKMFWRMVDEKKMPRHILVISEEPYIPWELMVPQRRLANGQFETREALGVEFSFGRWITDKYISPPQKIGFPQTYVVAPQYPAGRQLRYSSAEVQTIHDCFQPVETISPAYVQNIDDVLGRNGAALLHFVCHGKAGVPQSISLEQDKEELSCWDIKALDGFLSSFQKSRTFVFMNACQVGRVAPELVGIGGFGNTFASIGASAVIAPLWSVDDRIAHEVAEIFYRRVIAQPTIPFAEILRYIRARAYSAPAEDTWAAYCFYGDPLARLV
jgi:CHAT domain-containing protein